MGLLPWNWAAFFSSCRLLEHVKLLPQWFRGHRALWGEAITFPGGLGFSLDLFLLAHLSSLGHAASSAWGTSGDEGGNASCCLEVVGWGWYLTAVLKDRGQWWKRLLLESKYNLDATWWILLHLKGYSSAFWVGILVWIPSSSFKVRL